MAEQTEGVPGGTFEAVAGGGDARYTMMSARRLERHHQHTVPSRPDRASDSSASTSYTMTMSASADQH